MRRTGYLVLLLSVALALVSASDATAGRDWTNISPSMTVAPMLLGFDPSTNKRVFVGSFGEGLFFTEDGGNSWTRIFTDFFEGDGVATTIVVDVEFDPADGVRGTAITFSGAYFTLNRGYSWTRHPANDVGDSPAIGHSLALIPDGSGVAASEFFGVPAGGTFWIYRWADNSWTLGNAALQQLMNGGTLGLGFDRSSPAVLYTAHSLRKVFWTDDLGASLCPFGNGLPSENRLPSRRVERQVGIGCRLWYGALCRRCKSVGRQSSCG